MVPSKLKANAHEIVTDVVELVAGRRDAITPGASVEGQNIDNPGTLACFAWNATAQLVGLTAGHVARGATRYVTPAGAATEFGYLDAMSLTPVDAATIIITSPKSQVLPDGSRMVGVRQLTQYDVDHPVYVFGSRTGMWSQGRIIYLAPWVAGWNIADGVVYTSPTRPGDSGGPVVDQNGYLVAVHLGRGDFHGRDVAIAGAIGRIAHNLQLTPTF